MAEQDWMELMIFKQFVVQDWSGFNFLALRLESDWKILQFAHLCSGLDPSEEIVLVYVWFV